MERYIRVYRTDQSISLQFINDVITMNRTGMVFLEASQSVGIYFSTRKVLPGLYILSHLYEIKEQTPASTIPGSRLALKIFKNNIYC